jgi:hypothetical protein
MPRFPFFACSILLSILLLAGCAQQPFTSIDRSKYKTVALNPDIKAPAHYVYRDITGKRSRGMFGLIGAMVGAASEGSGFQRFDAAASKNPIDIRAVVRRQVEEALRTSKLLSLAQTDADTTLKIEILAYGVGPVHGRELGGIVAARVMLTGRGGALIWKKDEWATSNTTTLLENLEANPALWPRMANEAAAELAKKLILVSNTTQRTVAEPLM